MKIKIAYDKYLLDILGFGGESGEENQPFLGRNSLAS